MTSIGGFKAHRTRTITGLETDNREVPAIIAMRKNLPTANRAQTNELQDMVTDLLAQLQSGYDKMASFNQKIEAEYIRLADEAGLGEFHALLTTDAPRIRQIEKSITILTNFKLKTQHRLAEIDKAEQPAEAQPKQEMQGLQEVQEMAQALLHIAERFEDREPVGLAAAAHPAAQGGGGNANIVPHQLEVKLPKLEIAKFSGDILKWTAFWQQFESAIHRNVRLPEVSKFNYLLGLLEGEARDTVKGFQVTPENYTAAIALLTERFGKTDLIIDSHYQSLFNLGHTKGNVSDLRAFYENVESTLRALEALGEDVTTNKPIIGLIQSKLPRDVMKEMETKKGIVDRWTMTNTRRLLKENLELNERLDQRFEQSTSEQFTSKVSPPVSHFSKFSKPPKATGEALLAQDQSRRYNKPTFSKTCIYCEKPHYADECRTYPSLADRKARIKGKCFLCLKQGHIVPNCTANTTCYHCQTKGNHHRSLCPQKFASAKPSDKPGKGLGKSPTDTQQQVMCVDEKSEVKLLAPGKKVYMQTAQVTVANPKNLAIQEQVRAFLDTGCQTTCITSRLAKKMGLKVGPSVQKTFVRYGSDEIETKMVSYADITVILDDTDEKTLTVEVTDKITGKNQRLPVSFEVMKEIRHIKLSDTCPKEVETYTIEFLIGLDYYMDFLIPSILAIKGQSHLFLQASLFGYLLSGRTEDTVCTGYTGEPQMLAMNGKYTQIDTALFNSDSSGQHESTKAVMYLDTVGINNSTENSDDLLALSKFHESVPIIDGRLGVGCLLKEEFQQLPTDILSDDNMDNLSQGEPYSVNSVVSVTDQSGNVETDKYAVFTGEELQFSVEKTESDSHSDSQLQVIEPSVDIQVIHDESTDKQLQYIQIHSDQAHNKAETISDYVENNVKCFYQQLSKVQPNSVHTFSTNNLGVNGSKLCSAVSFLAKPLGLEGLSGRFLGLTGKFPSSDSNFSLFPPTKANLETIGTSFSLLSRFLGTTVSTWKFRWKWKFQLIKDGEIYTDQNRFPSNEVKKLPTNYMDDMGSSIPSETESEHEDMTTEHFLMAMRRFIARFGKPDLIISDNAPQFKLSDTVLANVWSDIIHDPEIQSYVSDKGIEWKFIVEFAPWMGGFYERMVGLVKMALKKTLPKVTLSSVQLCTLLAEIQSVVNSRPLTYTGEDVKSNMSLSPAHFLTMNPKIGFPEIAEEFDTENDSNYQEGTRQNSGQRLQELWKKGQKHLDRFWDHFEKEYLPSLRETMKTNIQQGQVKSSEFPKVGDVVHIKEDKQPRGTWKLGRISKLLPSQDGEIRTAEIRLPTKRFLKRRINLLYPLECSTEVEPTDEGNKLPPNDMDKQGILGILDTEKKEEVKQKPTRQAAMKARRDIQSLADQNLI